MASPFSTISTELNMRFLLAKDSPKEVTIFGDRIALIIAVWFVLVCWLAFSGGFERPQDQPPVAVVAAFVSPIVVFFVCYRISPKFHEFVLSIDLPLATWEPK